MATFAIYQVRIDGEVYAEFELEVYLDKPETFEPGTEAADKIVYESILASLGLEWDFVRLDEED